MKKSINSKQMFLFSTLLLFAIAILRIIYDSTTSELYTTNQVEEQELPIYSVDIGNNKEIALSFDINWGNEHISSILKTLKAHNVTATFFPTGIWVAEYPDDLLSIYEAGHEIGNQGNNHKDMSTLEINEIEDEILTLHNTVKELTGYDMSLFRPPYGAYDNDLIETCNSLGYYAIQWNVDSLDWMNYGTDSIIHTVTTHPNLTGGSIILCHTSADDTASALDELLTTLKDMGYSFVPISELIYKDNYELDHEGRQTKLVQ